MSDETEVATEPRPSGRGKAVVIALVVLVVVLVTALASLSRGAPEAPEPTGDAAATLDSALAAGTPAYVLIHSLT